MNSLNSRRFRTKIFLLEKKKTKLLRFRAKKAFFLITVLSSVALLTAVITHMTREVSRSSLVLSNIKSGIIADSLCDTALDIVKEILKDDLSRNRYDFYSEDFADMSEFWSKTYILPVDVLYGTVRVIITDEKAKLNVNALVDTRGSSKAIAKRSYLRIFERFFKIMQLDERLAGYILDWIDFDTEGFFEVPDARNWFIPFPEELIKIINIAEGVGVGEGGSQQGTFAGVGGGGAISGVASLFSEYFEGRPDAMGSPYFTFWPYAGGLEINVNTAPREVIAAMIDNDAALDIADEIVRERREKPFKTFSGFINFLAKLIPPIPRNFFQLKPEFIFTVRSDIFSVRIYCSTYDGVESGIQAVVRRGNAPGENIDVLFFRRF